jgi:D-alanyl-D-alanine carboxypeptidase/D-alanyl-D-alanine-endopeptidase (penicillin-binding protein 4)
MTRRLLHILAALGAVTGLSGAAAAPSAGARAAASAADVRAVLATSMRRAGASAGAAVTDLATGRILFADRPDVERVPASVNKLLITGAALAALGPDATLGTEALALGEPVEGVLHGGLWLRGGGDFTFDRADARLLAQRVASAGVREITGGVVGDESAFDRLRGPPSAGYGLSMWVGPLSALSYEHGRTGIRWPYWQATPALFAAQAFQRALKAEGVVLGRAARRGIAPAEAAPVAGWSSPALADLARHVNAPSDNYGAELLLKALGLRVRGDGSTAGGARAVREILAGAGVAARVVDGSGLARANRVSPANVGRLLGWMAAGPAAAAFEGSLAIAGRTGTLRRRMRGTAAQDRCSAKTGTLARVSALAGYCTTVSGARVAFAFLMNGIQTGRARALQDRMTAALARYDGVVGVASSG